MNRKKRTTKRGNNCERYFFTNDLLAPGHTSPPSSVWSFPGRIDLLQVPDVQDLDGTRRILRRGTDQRQPRLKEEQEYIGRSCKLSVTPGNKKRHPLGLHCTSTFNLQGPVLHPWTGTNSAHGFPAVLERASFEPAPFVLVGLLFAIWETGVQPVGQGRSGQRISPILLQSHSGNGDWDFAHRPISTMGDEVFPQCGVIFGKVFL